MHTVSYKNLTPTITPLLQALGDKLCSRGLYAAPAGDAEWKHGACVRVGVWHYGEVAGICSPVVKVELLGYGDSHKRSCAENTYSWSSILAPARSEVRKGYQLQARQDLALRAAVLRQTSVSANSVRQ